MENNSDPPDAALLERARAGDAGALEALLTRHQAQVYRFGLKLCRDPEDAKDVLQDTLLAMARGVRDFRGASSISTWLYSIARGFCVKKRRTRKGEPLPRELRSIDTDAAQDAARLADGSRTPEDVLAARQVARALEHAIGALDPIYREVLLLRDVEGLPAQEVAEVLGIGVAAVKSRLHRARLSVRARVAPLLGVPPAPKSPACPDVLPMFSRYLEGDIDPSVCADMERHLEQCPWCRGACDSLKRTIALCRTTAPDVAVPPDVQASVRVALHDLLAPRA